MALTWVNVKTLFERKVFILVFGYRRASLLLCIYNGHFLPGWILNLLWKNLEAILEALVGTQATCFCTWCYLVVDFHVCWPSVSYTLALCGAGAFTEQHHCLAFNPLCWDYWLTIFDHQVLMDLIFFLSFSWLFRHCGWLPWFQFFCGIWNYCLKALNIRIYHCTQWWRLGRGWWVLSWHPCWINASQLLQGILLIHMRAVFLYIYFKYPFSFPVLLGQISSVLHK